MCDLLNIKHIGGRPSSAPKLTIDTEYISRASRALAAVTLVKRATASEIAVQRGSMDTEPTIGRQLVDDHGYHDWLHLYGSGADEHLSNIFKPICVGSTPDLSRKARTDESVMNRPRSERTTKDTIVDINTDLTRQRERLACKKK